VNDRADLPLDNTKLRNRLAELGLKQWWLAEQIGVDRRTVMRWVNGQVQQLHAGNAARLAAVLDCRVEDLLRDGARAEAHLASIDDQRAAGAAIAGARLLDRLGPVHEWDVAEQLIKAVVVPGLPRAVLGRLYHQLAVACWRQDKLDEAARHTTSALAIAQAENDHELHALALGSRANLHFWAGRVAEALADWRSALALARWLEPPERGKLHCNLGASLAETGEPAAGRAELHTALRCFDDGGTPMQRAIAHQHLAQIALDEGDHEAAERELRHGEALARQGAYRRGLAFGARQRALLHAARGERAAAIAALEESDAAFAALGIREALNARVAAAVWRQLGEHERARAAIAEGRTWAAGFPLEAAALSAEAARIEEAKATDSA
jgi:DNA-binding Xre family transcriptional regulator/Tfp pilus assembly protein PilF